VVARRLEIIVCGRQYRIAKNGTPFAKDVWVLDMANKEVDPVDLTKRAGDDVDPAWSPTGNLIAFTSYYREDNLPSLLDEQRRTRQRVSVNDLANITPPGRQ
jgi:Tol biopolymer transport system component